MSRFQVGLVDRIGVSGSVGPYVNAGLSGEAGTHTEPRLCADMTVGLKANVRAFLDVIVKRWEQSLVNRSWQLWTGEKCSPQLEPPSFAPSGNPVIATTGLADGAVGRPYSAALETADGRYGTWAVAGLPAGLTVTRGHVAGTPVAVGDYPLIVTFTDGAHRTTTADLVLRVLESPSGPDVVAISTGYMHSLSAGRTGEVYGWGSNGWGQLGDGTMHNVRTSPVPMLSLEDVVAVSAGGQHFSLALTDDGSVYSLGYNGNGQLGLPGIVTSAMYPALIPGLTDVASISAGGSHAIAVTTAGEVYSWGSNSYGELGDGTTLQRATPVAVLGLSDVVEVTSSSHSLALTADGRVFAWGPNSQGQLGDGTTELRTVPVMVEGLRDVVAVSAGGSHSLALTSDGVVYAWGANWGGSLGDGTADPSPTPVAVQGLANAVAISAGGSRSFAVTTDGSVYAWGSNSDGALGDGTREDRYLPVQISGVSGALSVSSGSFYSLALTRSGQVYGWGMNDHGQLGDGTTTWRDRPVLVQFPGR